VTSKPVKHSVAVIVRNGPLILSVRRPDDDDELPDVWGLPAGTIRGSETVADLIHRIGEQKLGVHLSPVRKLAEGIQERSLYRLEMELWEAQMTGTPVHPNWVWTDLSLLKAGQAKGSLCCDLALERDGGV
jgi:hypothetical protein